MSCSRYERYLERNAGSETSADWIWDGLSFEASVAVAGRDWVDPVPVAGTGTPLEFRVKDADGVGRLFRKDSNDALAAGSFVRIDRI